MANIDFKTVLMKLINVFPKDAYLVHNWCAIAGDESNDENRGSYMCIFEPDVRDVLNKMFPNNPIIYIKSVRETKADITKIQEILDMDIINDINSEVELFMNNFHKYDTWETFNFSDSDIASVFDDGNSLTLFENEEDRSPVIISKSVFPLITGKTINNVRYNYDRYDDDETLNQITLVYDYELFQLVMRYLFLKI